LVDAELDGVVVVKRGVVWRQLALLQQILSPVGVTRLALRQIQELLETLQKYVLRLQLAQILLEVFVHRLLVDHGLDRGLDAIAFGLGRRLLLQNLLF